MKKHLELTSTKPAQQTILLKQLPNWDLSQLEEKLCSLQSKGIITLSNNNLFERKISLEGFSQEKHKEKLQLVDDKEKELWLLLKNHISK